MGCNCNGTSSPAAAAAGGGSWAIRLPNGTLVGVFPTEQAAEQSRRSVYNNAGAVVKR